MAHCKNMGSRSRVCTEYLYVNKIKINTFLYYIPEAKVKEFIFVFSIQNSNSKITFETFLNLFKNNSILKEFMVVILFKYNFFDEI